MLRGTLMKYVTSYMSVHEQRTLCYSEYIQENKAAVKRHAAEYPRAKELSLYLTPLEKINAK